MQNKPMNRRGFLGTSASAGLALASMAKPQSGRAGPNDTIRVGVLGPGGRGSRLMKQCIQEGEPYNARVTAICDIWKRRREEAVKPIEEVYGTKAKVYHHMDQLLADKDIDAVIIATADHQHAKMLQACIEAGKDVYCEKPMANVLSEANDVLDVARKSDRVIQIGTQGRSNAKCRTAADVMASGDLGDIVKVTFTENEYSPYRWARKKKDLESVTENDINWKEFLFGKPDRPFDARIFRSFRLFREFSSGIFDQWMTHDIDTCHYLTGQPYPLRAMTMGGIYEYRDYRENPDTVQVLFEYGRGDKKFLATYACCLVSGSGTGYRIQGARGTLFFDGSPLRPDRTRWYVSGDGVEKRKDAFQGKQELTDKPGTLHHMANWLAAIRKRDKNAVYCPVESGYGHSVACIMATDSLWSRRQMIFDPDKREIRAG